MAIRAAEFRATGLDPARLLVNPPVTQPYQQPKPPPQQQQPTLPAGSAPQPRTCFTCGHPGHVKIDYPQSAPPLGGPPKPACTDGNNAKSSANEKAKEGRIIQGLLYLTLKGHLVQPAHTVNALVMFGPCAAKERSLKDK